MTIRAVALTATTALILSGALVGCTPAQPTDVVTLTMTTGDDDKTGPALVDAFNASHPAIQIDLEVIPAGTYNPPQNLVTGDAADIIKWYTGVWPAEGLLNAKDTLLDLSDEAFVEKLSPLWINSTTSGGSIWSIPSQTASVGGIFFSKAIYKELGLEVPTTYEEFIDNSIAIRDAGYPAVAEAFGDFFPYAVPQLLEWGNQYAENPDFVEEFMANEIKFADLPRVGGFQFYEDLHELSLLNDDFESALDADVLSRLAQGEIGQYAALGFSVAQLLSTNPEAGETVGFFPLPGDDPDRQVAVVWAFGGVYFNKTLDNDDAKRAAAVTFADWLLSPESCTIQAEAVQPQGPFFVEGCDLPADLPPLVQEMVAAADKDAVGNLQGLVLMNGDASMAIEVTKGNKSALEAAQAFDAAVEQQAKTAGLPGW